MNPEFRRTLRARAALCMLAFGTAGAVHPAPLAAQHEDHGTFDAKSQFGSVSFANSGAKAAQQAFLRGLALLHNFQYPQAAEAFREAQKIDPGFAMAYWGEAMTYNHGIWTEQDSVAARAVLARLGATEQDRLAKAPTSREKDYLRTLDVLYSTTGTKPARDSAYSRAMAQLSARYPEDVDAQLFHALSLLSLFPRTDSTYMRAATIAAKVMRDHPQHPGAVHYVIHAYDDPAHASLGLAAARAYSKIAPNAPHAQHMTSHIFVALGMWDDVVAANEVALHTNEAERGATAVAEAMCGHAGLWLHYAYLQQGRLADARRMMDGCREGSAKSPAMAHGYALMRVRYLIDGDQPPEIVAMPSTLPTVPPARFALEYGTALDAYRRGDTTTLATAADRLGEIQRAFDASAHRQAAPEMSAMMGVREDQVRALALERRGRKDEAETLLRQTGQKEDALPFMFGPPAIEKPSHELFGEVLVENGKPAEATHELELALKRTPGRSLTLLDLARARRAAGNVAGANAAYQQVAANWHRADPSLPALREARSTTVSTARALTHDQLISFSVLPLPENLRVGAGVVELDAHAQPTELRKSSNGMVCARFVPGEEDWDARCYHESFAPLFFRSRQLAADGMKGATVTARIDDELKQGKLHLPDHPTAGYRLLGPADSYDPSTGRTTDQMRFWQSVHMPFRTAAELGFPIESDVPGPQRATTPFVMASGTWWAHVMIEHARPR